MRLESIHPNQFLCINSRVFVWLDLSHVQMFAIPWTVAHQAPLSMGILQAGILEWVAMPFSKGSSQPRDRAQASCAAGGFFTIGATRKAPLIAIIYRKTHFYLLYVIYDLKFFRYVT